MSELILHIGMPKAGSSALQLFFNANAELLEKQGVSYPAFTPQREGSEEANGVFLRWYCHEQLEHAPKGSHPRDVEENLSRLRDALAGTGRVLISNEDLFIASALLSEQEGALDAYWNQVAKTVLGCGAEKLRIIVYLRRQDDYVASRWKQEVLLAFTSLNFEEFAADPARRSILFYDEVLAAIERAFGDRAEIAVRPYSYASFAGGDIFHDFCLAAGIEWDASFTVPGKPVNSSVSFDVADAVRSLLGPNPERLGLESTVYIDCCDAYRGGVQAAERKGETPFDEEETRAFLEPFLEGNGRVSERYLGGAPLFSDVYGGRPVWRPDAQRTSELAEQIRGEYPRGLARIKRKGAKQALKNALPKPLLKLIKSLRRAES